MHIQRTNILDPAIAALAIAAFLLMQDRQGTVYPEALLRADSIVSKQPDSAAVILDGLEHGIASAPEAVRMRYRLIRQKQIAYSFGRFTSDSAARALVEYYETRGERSGFLRLTTMQARRTCRSTTRPWPWNIFSRRSTPPPSPTSTCAAGHTVSSDIYSTVNSWTAKPSGCSRRRIGAAARQTTRYP